MTHANHTPNPTRRRTDPATDPEWTTEDNVARADWNRRINTTDATQDGCVISVVDRDNDDAWIAAPISAFDGGR